MSGVKGKSGRRIASPATLDKLLSLADTIVLRAIKNKDLPEMERAKLAAQFTLKKIAERKENVNINLQLSDELVRRMMAALEAERPRSMPPSEVLTMPTGEGSEPSEPNEPKEEYTIDASRAAPEAPQP